MKHPQAQIQQRQGILEKMEQSIDAENDKLQQLSGQIQAYEQKLSEQKALYRRLCDKIPILDNEINLKAEDKQKILGSVKYLEETALPQGELAVQKITEDVGKVQTDVQQRQATMEKVIQESASAKMKLAELEKTEILLRKEYQATEANLDRFKEELMHLETIIHDKMKQRDALTTRLSQAKSTTDEYTGLLNRAKESSRLLRNEINQRNTVLKEIAPDFIFVHYEEDTHQDHRNVARTVVPAARSVPSLLHFEGLSSAGFAPTVFVNIGRVLHQKLASLEAHASQMERTNIESMNILDISRAAASFSNTPANC